VDEKFSKTNVSFRIFEIYTPRKRQCEGKGAAVGLCCAELSAGWLHVLCCRCRRRVSTALSCCAHRRASCNKLVLCFAFVGGATRRQQRKRESRHGHLTLRLCPCARVRKCRLWTPPSALLARSMQACLLRRVTAHIPTTAATQGRSMRGTRHRECEPQRHWTAGCTTSWHDTSGVLNAK